MTESFEDVMAFMRKAITDDCDQTYCSMYDDDCYACEGAVLDRLQKAHDHKIIELQRQYEQNVIELQSAHEREMDAVRDPQRIGGRHAPDSFVYAIEQLREFRWQHATNDDDAIPYINGVAKAHDHEMEQLRRSRFREGYVAGQRSMDAEHYAVALRLKHLPLDEDSHGNLSQIARAVWHSDFGWTNGACEALRDELVRLLGGVHDEPAPIPATCGACDADCDCHNQQPQAVAYDVLGNERHKAVCELRNARDRMSDNMADNVSRIMYAIDARPKVGERACEAIADRLIHLLGRDEPLPNLSEPNLSKSVEVVKPESEDGGEVTITDELRKFATDPLLGYASQELHVERITAIADRIDEQFNHAMISRSAELGCYKLRINQLEQERDELKKKLDSARGAIRHITNQWDISNKKRRELQKKLDTIREALDG